MYTRSRGANQTQQNTSFVRGPTLNASNQGYQTGNANAAAFGQSTPQKQGQVQNAGQRGAPQQQKPIQQQHQQQHLQQQQQQQMKPMQQQMKPMQQQQQQQQQQQKPVQQATPQKIFQPQQQQQTPQKTFQPTPQQPEQKSFPQTPEKPQINAQPQKTPVPNPNQNNPGASPAAAPSQGNQENPMDYDDVMPEVDGFSETSDQPKWRRAKLQGTKVNRKLKRLRMNQRLRKTLMPKNAIMVLNEMKAGVQFTFPETQSIPNSLFLVHAELDGKTYVGQGLSKPLARQNAAENALKCLLLEKMTAAANKARTDAENDSQGGGESADTTKEGVSAEGVAAAAVAAAEGGQAQQDTGVTPMSVDETDEIPWSSLASFALYKLFLEWQNQGTVVPIPRPGTQTPPKIRAESKPPTERVLPENALSVHPVMLLNQMKPGITYVEVSRSGNPPHTMFTLSVEIDEKVFTGSAKNKRDAKKIAAKAALRALYNLEYPEEVKLEPVEPMQVTEAMLQQPLQ